MTVMAAIVDGGRVWMACDSQATDGFGRKWMHHPSQPKIVRRQVGERGLPILMGSVGHGDLLGVIERLSILGHPDADDDDDCNGWAAAVGANWCESAMDLVPPPTTAGGDGPDGAFLLAAAGRLWHCAGHQAMRVDRFTAAGSGGDYALGVLHGFAAIGRLHDPHAALAIAVETACVFDESCGGPVVVEQI